MKTTTMTWFAIAAVAGALHAGCGDDTTTPPTTTTTTTGPGGGGAGAGDPGSYAFDTTEYGDYVQTDRHGAVEAGTIGIAVLSGLGLNGEDIELRDAYNASDPVADADGEWAPEIIKSVGILHTALDDDLTAAGLTPATGEKSVAQAGPVVIPDTIKYDPSKETAYPNGRTLTDQVVDITVAAALVDLAVHPLSVLADLPLNPDANDVPFKNAFPYLADPH